MTALIPIPSSMLPEAWPEIEPFISAIADGSNGRLISSDYIRALAARDMQLWAARDGQEIIGAMISEVLNYPQKRIASMIAATGRNADTWLALMPEIERWAKIEKCAGLQAVCRPGWEKLLKPIGFNKTHVVLEKPL